MDGQARYIRRQLVRPPPNPPNIVRPPANPPELERATELALRGNALGAKAYEAIAWAGAAETADVDSSTQLELRNIKRLQLCADSPVTIRYHETPLVAVPPGRIIEVRCENRGDLNVVTDAGTGGGTETEDLHLGPFPLTLNVAGPNTEVEADQLPLESLEHGQSVYQATFVGTGTFRLEGLFIDRPLYAVPLTADIDITTVTGTPTVLPYLSDALRRWPGLRRVQTNLGGASSITFDALFHGWMNPRREGRDLTPNATVRVHYFIDRA
jgi:hypothetical protein